MHLQLEKSLIRNWRDDDLTSLVENANDRAVALNLRDSFPHPYTLADGRTWLRLMKEMTPVTHFAIVINGVAIGGIGFQLQSDIFRHSAEIGYWLGQKHWGKGVMSEAVIAVTEYAFTEFKLNRVYAGVFAWNPASSRLLEKAGYQLEGRLQKSVTKDGKTIDQLLYAKIH